jgi:hypothetical protein
MTDTPEPSPATPALVYKASNKHCEPMTAQRTGTKCPRWAAKHAQDLLKTSVPIGGQRMNVRHGLAFVAQDTADGTWHGYPEAWDKIPQKLTDQWISEGRLKRRDRKRWWAEQQVCVAWKELEDAE